MSVISTCDWVSELIPNPKDQRALFEAHIARLRKQSAILQKEVRELRVKQNTHS